MKCKVCTREAEENGYCSLHLMAYNNILDKFEVWQKASNISWKQYLVQIQKNSLTGEWAKDVIKQLIRDENEACHHTK